MIEKVVRKARPDGFSEVIENLSHWLMKIKRFLD